MVTIKPFLKNLQCVEYIRYIARPWLKHDQCNEWVKGLWRPLWQGTTRYWSKPAVVFKSSPYASVGLYAGAPVSPDSSAFCPSVYWKLKTVYIIFTLSFTVVAHLQQFAILRAISRGSLSGKIKLLDFPKSKKKMGSREILFLFAEKRIWWY